MLLPLLAALTALRAWTVGAQERRAWLPALGLAAITVIALLAFRQACLGRLGGYGDPQPLRFIANYVKGIESGVFLWPTTRIWQAAASVATVATLVVGLALAKWRSPRIWVLLAGVGLGVGLILNVPPAFGSKVHYSVVAWQGLASASAISLLVLGLGAAIRRQDRLALFLLLGGLGIALSFNLPFVLVTKREQYNLVGLGAVVALAGAAQALWTLRPRWGPVWLSRVLLVAATVPFPFLSRHLAADFLPCAGPVLSADEGARGWWVVPVEVRSWLDSKRTLCGAGVVPPRLADLPIVSWDVYAEEREADSVPYRWTSERPVLLLRRDSTAVTLAVRRPDASVDHPVRVTLRSSSGTAVVTLTSGDWSSATVNLTDGPLAWLRRGQRIGLHVEPWFVPAARDRQSRDLRRHGVQLNVVDSR
jgi:hypothetical protein